MVRPLFIALPSLLVLVACTPPPDSPTRTDGGQLRVQLDEPRTCLERACLQYSARLGRVNQPEREMVRIPDGMVDADGFVSASDFRELLRETRLAPPMDTGVTRLMSLGSPHPG